MPRRLGGLAVPPKECSCSCSNAGFAVGVGADGKIQQVEPINPTSGQNSSGPTPGAHVSRSYLFWIAIGGGGIAAVTAILLTRKSSPPVSPASP